VIEEVRAPDGEHRAIVFTTEASDLRTSVSVLRTERSRLSWPPNAFTALHQQEDLPSGAFFGPRISVAGAVGTGDQLRSSCLDGMMRWTGFASCIGSRSRKMLRHAVSRETRARLSNAEAGACLSCAVSQGRSGFGSPPRAVNRVQAASKRRSGVPNPVTPLLRHPLRLLRALTARARRRSRARRPGGTFALRPR
jgi:hypothetical protein